MKMAGSNKQAEVYKSNLRKKTGKPVGHVKSCKDNC